MGAAKGRSLELYFIDGRPDGMLTAEVFNWTGHVLMTPRTQIAAALARPEASYTGVYLLFGERDGEPLAYIGEAEDVSNRIRSHDSNKDWWETAVLVTSAANNLHKAHVQYLEARLVEEARAVGKVALDNAIVPSRPSLSEAARANMESFLEYLLMVLPALRIDYFLRQTRPTPSNAGQVPPAMSQPTFELQVPKHGIRATAELVNGEFVVQAGSMARDAWTANHRHSYQQLHADLVRANILVEQGPHRVFAENYAFKSPSAAASVVTGRMANGTLEWKVKGQTMTYKEWEEEQLAGAPQGVGR